jgi:hypothetical protein
MKEAFTTIQITVATRKKLKVVIAHTNETYKEWVERKVNEELKQHQIKIK